MMRDFPETTVWEELSSRWGYLSPVEVERLAQLSFAMYEELKSSLVSVRNQLNDLLPDLDAQGFYAENMNIALHRAEEAEAEAKRLTLTLASVQMPPDASQVAVQRLRAEDAEIKLKTAEGMMTLQLRQLQDTEATCKRLTIENENLDERVVRDEVNLARKTEEWRLRLGDYQAEYKLRCETSAALKAKQATLDDLAKTTGEYVQHMEAAVESLKEDHTAVMGDYIAEVQRAGLAEAELVELRQKYAREHFSE